MEPYKRGKYDPLQARIFYKQHPALVLRRMLQVFRLSNQYLFNTLVDKYIFRDQDNPNIQQKRAKQLLQVVTEVGSTAIKIAQSLSVRNDLIGPIYAETLSSLQDRVPPFENSLAQQIVQQELPPELYQQLPPNAFKQDPVASASIGQVYKVTLLQDNQVVAIKVQRPTGLAEIALDLFWVREIVAPLWQKISKSATDLPGLASEWGRGFIAELDYRKEAETTRRFRQEMIQRGLDATVTAPKVVFDSERVLITEWIEGERIDQFAKQEDIPRLCAVALNAYLLMLLELQTLQTDPHPGNFLVQDNGRLVILDFGMTLDIAPTLQYSLLEFMAHLTAEEYDLLPEDLVQLGFLKKEKLEYAKRSGILEPLKYFLKQANQGGGAKGVQTRIIEEYRAKYPGLDDEALRTEIRKEIRQSAQEMAERESLATGVTVEVEELQRRNQDSFQLPDWFLYTSRAFLTLEGVSLAADPDFSLVKSCFPYIAKRLLADDDPRSRKALRDLIYGSTGAIDVDRLTDLADGFSSYTTTSKTLNQETKVKNGIVVSAEEREKARLNKVQEAEAAIALAKDSADILLTENGSLLQTLLLEEGALATSAGVKDSLRDAFVDRPKRIRDSLPFGVGSILPPLPFESQMEPFVRKTSAETKAQDVAKKIASLTVRRQPPGSDGNSSDPREAVHQFLERLRELDPEQAALVLRELRRNLPRYAPLLGGVGRKFASILLKTASKNVETTLEELERAGTEPDEVTKFTVRGFSSAAERGASTISSNFK